MKNFILIIILFIFLNKLSATVQTPDLLIIEKDTIELCEMSDFPLEFLNLKFRPFNYTRQTAPNTACWRGYQAIWRVIDNEIYLEKIQRCYGDENNDKIENLKGFFSKNQINITEKDGMILANWINLNLYELKSFYSKSKYRKIMLSDNWFGKKYLKIQLMS
ncbi:hypothetical protein [Niabella ginsengisoli]|uniref:Uncharacterized protein n=1 Tax=Niabella ginsengisoli TaxID=522298 RepID=A0ABS9SIB8_9BACT|nr:hypothetical protein [Niabella ginsengisoli]MCH5598097.1 hypothetical protein [Niabella ginsengisoli]